MCAPKITYNIIGLQLLTNSICKQCTRKGWRASDQIRNIAGCACAGNAGNVFPRCWLQMKPLVSDPGMHHGTCVTHVPWCMLGSLARGGGENVPGIPGACAPVILRIWQEAHSKMYSLNFMITLHMVTSIIPKHGNNIYLRTLIVFSHETQFHFSHHQPCLLTYQCWIIKQLSLAICTVQQRDTSISYPYSTPDSN